MKYKHAIDLLKHEANECEDNIRIFGELLDEGSSRSQPVIKFWSEEKVKNKNVLAELNAAITLLEKENQA